MAAATKTPTTLDTNTIMVSVSELVAAGLELGLVTSIVEVGVGESIVIAHISCDNPSQKVKVEALHPGCIGEFVICTGGAEPVMVQFLT